MHPLDRTQGADGHEDGRLDAAVVGGEQAGAGIGSGIGVLKVELHGGAKVGGLALMWLPWAAMKAKECC